MAQASSVRAESWALQGPAHPTGHPPSPLAVWLLWFLQPEWLLLGALHSMLSPPTPLPSWSRCSYILFSSSRRSHLQWSLPVPPVHSFTPARRPPFPSGLCLASRVEGIPPPSPPTAPPRPRCGGRLGRHLSRHRRRNSPLAWPVCRARVFGLLQTSHALFLGPHPHRTLGGKAPLSADVRPTLCGTSVRGALRFACGRRSLRPQGRSLPWRGESGSFRALPSRGHGGPRQTRPRTC